MARRWHSVLCGGGGDNGNGVYWWLRGVRAWRRTWRQQKPNGGRARVAVAWRTLRRRQWQWRILLRLRLVVVIVLAGVPVGMRT